MLSRSELTTWRTDAGNLDVLANIPARDGRRLRYEDLADRAEEVRGENLAARAAALEDIIASKEWANRPKDLEALPELRRLAAAQALNAEPVMKADLDATSITERVTTDAFPRPVTSAPPTPTPSRQSEEAQRTSTIELEQPDAPLELE